MSPNRFFNGTDFTGWRVPDGKSVLVTITKWSLEGMRQPEDSSRKRGYPLETVKDYQDFILEADVRYTAGTDAGIYFRKDHLLRCGLGFLPHGLKTEHHRQPPRGRLE